MNKNSFKLTSRDYLVVLSMLYASVSLAMNVFCMKPLSWGTDVVFSDGGQTISWIVFLISNVIVEVWGEKESIKVISFAAITTFLLLIIGRLLVMVPVLPEYTEQNNAFALVFSRSRHGFWAVPVALLLAFSRLYLQVHFPTDILGGILVGILAGGLGALLARKLLQTKKLHRWIPQ